MKKSTLGYWVVIAVLILSNYNFYKLNQENTQIAQNNYDTGIRKGKITEEGLNKIAIEAKKTEDSLASCIGEYEKLRIDCDYSSGNSGVPRTPIPIPKIPTMTIPNTSK